MEQSEFQMYFTRILHMNLTLPCKEHEAENYGPARHTEAEPGKTVSYKENVGDTRQATSNSASCYSRSIKFQLYIATLFSLFRTYFIRISRLKWQKNKLSRKTFLTKIFLKFF